MNDELKYIFNVCFIICLCIFNFGNFIFIFFIFGLIRDIEVWGRFGIFFVGF